MRATNGKHAFAHQFHTPVEAHSMYCSANTTRYCLNYQAYSPRGSPTRLHCDSVLQTEAETIRSEHSYYPVLIDRGLKGK